MTPLSFLLIIASILFLFFAVDGVQRKRFNILHFIVFCGGIGLILAFVFIEGFQEKFAHVFGVARGSDVIVYGALMLLGYFYFELLHAVTKHKQEFTRLLSATAIRQVQVHPHIPSLHPGKDDFVFLVRVYNEETSIGEVIDTIISAGFSKIVVVNDGSSDDSEHIIENKKQQYAATATIYLVSHSINAGGGAANKTGFAFIIKHQKALAAKWVVTYDADGQMDIADMHTFIEAMHQPKNAHTKVYLGTRFRFGGEAENMPLMRKVILRGSKIVTLLFNKIYVSDPHNGYRVISIDVLHDLDITSNNMTYASEILDSIRIHQIPFVEVPVRIQYTEYSLSKGQKNRNALKILGELIYKKIFFR